MTVEDLCEVKMYGITIDVEDKKFDLTVFTDKNEERASIEMIVGHEKYQWIVPGVALKHMEKILPVIKSNIKEHLIDKNFNKDDYDEVKSGSTKVYCKTEKITEEDKKWN